MIKITLVALVFTLGAVHAQNDPTPPPPPPEATQEGNQGNVL